MCLTRFRIVDSPMGCLTVAGQGDCLTNLVLDNSAHPPADSSRWVEDTGAFHDVVVQLDEYFAAKRRTFDIRIHPEGTSFQRRVWEVLCEIPYGENCSYGEIARRIGRPESARAVGSAIGRNPIAIVVPCHRVIGANGSLTGYAGGLEAKRALLELEAGLPLRAASP